MNKTIEISFWGFLSFTLLICAIWMTWGFISIHRVRTGIHKEAIERGFAEYSQTTGDWQWKGDTE